MINVPMFDGFEYTRESYEKYINDSLSMLDNIYDIHEIGNTVQGRKMYGFSLGDLKKPTIYIQGNIHGSHEWRTCYWVREFMNIIANPGNVPQSKKINEVKSMFSFYFIPSCNPDGFENGTYGNANGVSLSRNFDYLWNESPPREDEPYYKGPSPFSEPETQIIRDVLLDIKAVSLVCCHSWGGYTGFTIRGAHGTNVHDVLFENMYKSLYTSSKIPNGTDSKLSPKLNSPSVYNWMGHVESSIGVRSIAQVLETGTLETEYDQARLGLNGLYMHILYVYERVRNGNIIL